MSRTSQPAFGTGQRLIALAVAALVTTAVLGGVNGLATHYQAEAEAEAAYAAQQAAPASEHVVQMRPSGQRARRG
jgi:hypothetical protein